MTMGERLKALRKEKRMTLDDVAKRIGVGRATVLKYENGMITNVPSDKVESLATMFGVSPAYLMGWTDDPHEAKELDLQYFAQKDMPQTEEARIVSGGIDRMPADKREKALQLLQLAFSEYFKEDDHDA